MFCEHCGGRLHRCQGEAYCPDCLAFTVQALAGEAGDEARRLRLVPDGPDDDGKPDDGLPPW
jgi:uncharacterized Zn finger protein (UPF0148 family)